MKRKTQYEEFLADPATTKFEVIAINAIWGAFILTLATHGAPYKPLVAFLVAVPWLEIAARWLREVDIDKSMASEHLFGFAFTMPMMMLAITALGDVKHQLNWTQAIVPGICVGLLLTAVLRRSSDWISRNNSRAAFFGVLCVIHSILATGLENCLLDHSPPTTYTAKILGGRISYTKARPSYYLTVSPWGAQSKASEIGVAYDVYHGTKIGDTICIRSRRGAFHMTWIGVDNCNPDEIRGAAPGH